MNVHMIYHSEVLELEITAFEFYHDPTYTGELYHLKPQGVLDENNILLCETESSIPRAERVKKAKLEELSNNIRDQSEA